jgi:protein involved in polysaccharide export with SLBB domain
VLDRAGGLGPLADFDGAYLQRGVKKVPLDLRALVMMRDQTADRPVELGDTLVVPFKRRSIRVSGAVFAPGYYPHNPDFTIDEYVGLAGGPNRAGRKVSAARIIGPDGELRDYDRRLRLEPGSQIIIPERNFSPPEIVQILISTASVLVSGIAVVLAAKK